MWARSTRRLGQGSGLFIVSDTSVRIPAQGGNVVKHFRVDKAPSVVKVRLVNALAKSGHWSAELPVPAPIGIKLRKGPGEKDKRDTDRAAAAPSARSGVCNWPSARSTCSR